METEYELNMTLTAKGAEGYLALLNFARSSQWSRWKEEKGIKCLYQRVHERVRGEET